MIPPSLRERSHRTTGGYRWKIEFGFLQSHFLALNWNREKTSCYADTPAGREVFGRRFPNTPAARFTARAARANGFNITRDPEGDIENSFPEHFVLTFNKGARRGVYTRRIASDWPLSLSSHNHGDFGGRETCKPGWRTIRPWAVVSHHRVHQLQNLSFCVEPLSY